MAALNKNSAGDKAGNYYTSSGATPQACATDLYGVPVSTDISQPYLCPASSAAQGNSQSNSGPFTASGAGSLGPVASNRVWTPFAAWNNNTAALPLPHTIKAGVDGFMFSVPPVFNYGHNYEPQLPYAVPAPPPPQYYGNSQSDFSVAPATSPTAPVSFTLPADDSTPLTQLEGFSDWAATIKLAAATAEMDLTFANGSPLAFLAFNTQYAYFRYTTSNPVPQFWFPRGFAGTTPAGVNIQLGGASPVTQTTDLSVEVTINGASASVSYTTSVNQTLEEIAAGLQQACLANSQFTALVNIGAVVQSGASWQFLLTAVQAGVTLAPGDVAVNPTGGAQTILIPIPAPAAPSNPAGAIVGISLNGQANGASTSLPYNSSYALVAPAGAVWTQEAGGAALVCDLSGTGGLNTIIIVAMPSLPADAYTNYFAPDTGAAALLQSCWEMMAPYAYGCPRHVSNGLDDGTGTQIGPNDGQTFTPQVNAANGKLQVTTEFSYNLSYPAGQPEGASGTLFGLFPHQWRAYANNTATLLASDGQELVYQTVMGLLKLGGGGGTPGTPAFSTTYDAFPGILAALPNTAALTGTESFNVYDYPSPTAGTVNPQTLSNQMTQDAVSPVWSASFSGAAQSQGSAAQNAFIPVPPVWQQNWGLNSYDWGKYVGGLADLIQPAHLLNNTPARESAIRQLNAQLGQWLSGALLYADGQTSFPPGVEPWQTAQGNTVFAGSGGVNINQQFLYYDQQWSTFIPYPTAYYADTLINDHHFHYGYWLRAAAQLALAQAMGLDPDNDAGTFIANYGATVNLIVKDLANPRRGDQGAIGDSGASFPSGPATPFMRYFDPYFGHSWASGLPVNILNQESLSEAMSAWTGVTMWGELTGDTNMRNLGLWMYTQEMFSFYEYWMDCAQNASSASTLFPAGSPKNITASGYLTNIQGAMPTADLGFCTQTYNSYLELTSDFGIDPLFLTGIEWLPFHGGSLYLSSSDPAVNATLNAVFAWAQGNSEYQWNHKGALTYYQPTYFAVTWEPVAWNFAALIGAGNAETLWNALEQAVGSPGGNVSGSGWKPLGGESVSFSYYWIQTLCALGTRDASVTADSPFAVKFNNGSVATYVIWNLSGAVIPQVAFSDGHQVNDVGPYSLSVTTG